MAKRSQLAPPDPEERPHTAPGRQLPRDASPDADPEEAGNADRNTQTEIMDPDSKRVGVTKDRERLKSCSKLKD